MAAFCCYRLPALESPRGDGFDDYVEDHRQVMPFGPERAGDFEYKLYTAVGQPHQPPWAQLLRPLVGADHFPPQTGLGALIIVRLDDDPGRCFAFTFGTGRFLLRDRRWTRAYGLRVAVNLLCAGGIEADQNDRRIMSLDTTRLIGERRRSRAQSSRRTNMDTFEIDRFRDVVKGMTVLPVDDETWGPRLHGSDAVHFAGDYEVPDLGRLCRGLEDIYNGDEYKKDYGWLDDFKPISDPHERERLQDRVLRALRRGSIGDFELAPPEIIDWAHEVRGFKYPVSPRDLHAWLSIDDYLEALSARGHRVHMSKSSLDRKVTLVRNDGREVQPWSIWSCLVGELQDDEETYVLDGGDFWAVEKDYLRGLDSEIDALDLGSGGLPCAGETDTEASYHPKAAAAMSEPALVMHGDLVARPDTTGRIEICDVFTKSGRLFHFAWPRSSLSSRVLSHLFWQGQVSAFLLHEYPDFCAEATAKIRAKDHDAQFEAFPASGVSPTDHEVVYGIIAEWRHRPLARRLPFFSKVSLRATARELRKRHFRVSCLRIQAQRSHQQGLLPGIAM